MFPSLGDFMEGAAKNSAGADSSSSRVKKTPPRKQKQASTNRESSSNDNLCHQKQTAPATPPQVQAADLMTPPVAVVHTGKKKPRSVANERNDVISGSGGSGTTLTSATTEETCTVDEVSPMGSEGADESVPTSSPTNLEKILGMEEDIAPLPKSKNKGRKPPKTSRKSNKSSKSKSRSTKSAAAKSALPFLLGYEQMVRTQDAEDWATAVHLRPIFAKLRYIGGDTTVAPTLPSSSEKNSGSALPTSIMGNSDASVTSTGTYGTTLTTATDRTDAEREADALSYLSSYSGQHVDKCDGTILSFSAIAVSLSVLSSKKPDEEEMTLDRSLMLMLQTIVEATALMEDIGSSGGITFPEFLHGYKTITNAMQTIQRFPSTTTEGQHHKAQTRDRAHQMIQSFVRVPSMIQVPVVVEEPKTLGEATNDSNITKPVQEKEIASTSATVLKAVLLHMAVALVCGTGASTMWARYVPPQNNMTSQVDTKIVNESDVVAVEQEEEPEPQRPLGFSQRSVEHFGLRKEIRTIGARSKRWMKSAHKCQESLETLHDDFEEASLTMMELMDKSEEQPECIPSDINNDKVVDVVVPAADVIQSIDEIIQSKPKSHVKAHIVSAMGGASLTTLASKVLIVDRSTKVISAAAAAASPLALAMGTARRQIMSVLGGATMSSLASRTLVEGTAKVVTGAAANSLAVARVIGAAVGSPFALVMTVGSVALVIASVVENNNGNNGDTAN